VRIERAGSEWVLVDGQAPSEARWRLRGEDVEVASSSGRVYVVPPGDVPIDVAVALLALRDARRFVASARSESAASFALRAWVETSRDPLLVGRIDSGERTPSWMDYRFAFLTATTMGSGEHDLGIAKGVAGRGRSN
jgi:hypothetical protein